MKSGRGLAQLTPGQLPSWISLGTLSKNQCVHCYGRGVRQLAVKREGHYEFVCSCVYRRVFQIVVKAYEDSHNMPTTYSGAHTRLPGLRMRSRPDSCSMPYTLPIEMRANVDWALRQLDPRFQRLFHHHYRLKKEWNKCVPQLAKNRGAFFHDVYRLQEQAGAVFLSRLVFSPSFPVL